MCKDLYVELFDIVSEEMFTIYQSKKVTFTNDIRKELFSKKGLRNKSYAKYIYANSKIVGDFTKLERLIAIYHITGYNLITIYALEKIHRNCFTGTKEQLLGGQINILEALEDIY